MIDRVAKFVSETYRIFLMSSFLSLVLFVGWNYGFRKFLAAAPQVEWLDCVVVLFSFQLISTYTYRKRDLHVVPVIYLKNETKTQTEEIQPDITTED